MVKVGDKLICSRPMSYYTEGSQYRVEVVARNSDGTIRITLVDDDGDSERWRTDDKAKSLSSYYTKWFKPASILIGGE